MRFLYITAELTQLIAMGTTATVEIQTATASATKSYTWASSALVGSRNAAATTSQLTCFRYADSR